MDFFWRSRLAPKVADDEKQSFIDSHKANVVGTGAFQYNREIVVRRIPCEGLVSNIVASVSGRRLIEVKRALAPQMRKEPMPCPSSPFKTTFEPHYCIGSEDSWRRTN